MTEFPRDLLPLLRCSSDAAALKLTDEVRSGEIGIIQGRLRCTRCGLTYRIEDGIARMLREEHLSHEDRHEIAIRDIEYGCTDGEPFVPPEASWRSELSDLVEIPALLRMLAPLDGARVLELGCGDGRLTMLMAQMGAQVIALDFSINGLRRMAGWLSSGAAPTVYRPKKCRTGDLRPFIGLVEADVSRFCVKPGSFQRALSATPLDSREQRMKMYSAVADALADDGLYVGSFEHDDLLRRLLGLPLARRYERGGIYIEHFEDATIRRESAPFFLKQRFQCIRPRIPLAGRLPKSMAVRLLRAIDRVPYVRNFGEILLLVAGRPVRLPEEGSNREGSRLVKNTFRWYTRRLGKRPVWGSDEFVA